MKYLSRLLLVVLIFAACKNTSKSDSDQAIVEAIVPKAQLNDSIKGRLDWVVRNLATSGKCRVTAVIGSDSTASYFSGYDGRQDIEITDFTPVIEIGSCSKMFTATAILQLVEQDKIALDDRLTSIITDDVLKDLLTIDGKNYIDSIKVINLLNHSSGLPEYFIKHDDKKEIEIHGDPTLKFSAEDLINMAKEHRTNPFIPGTSFDYCNLNYILLGMIIEKVSGQTYQAYFEEHIIEPLDLNHTYLATLNAPSNLVQGHYGGEVLNKPSMPPSLAGPAGEILADLGDMQKFVSEWYKGSLFRTPEMRESVLNDDFMEMSSIMYYGKGTIKLSDTSWGHAGQTFGFQTYMTVFDSGYSLSLAVDDAAVASITPVVQLLDVLGNSK